MWVGDVGQTGANGVGRLLVGETTPSGSLVDTFWYDNMLNPAVVNFYTIPYQGYEKYNLLLEGSDIQGMVGKDFDDPEWEELLDQLTFEEMVNTITLGFHNTAGCESILLHPAIVNQE